MLIVLYIHLENDENTVFRMGFMTRTHRYHVLLMTVGYVGVSQYYNTITALRYLPGLPVHRTEWLAHTNATGPFTTAGKKKSPDERDGALLEDFVEDHVCLQLLFDMIRRLRNVNPKHARLRRHPIERQPGQGFFALLVD